jgi:hypothetical protein
MKNPLYRLKSYFQAEIFGKNLPVKEILHSGFSKGKEGSLEGVPEPHENSQAWEPPSM